MVLLTEGRLGTFSSKTATSLVRYKRKEVVAVLDSTRAGENLEDIIEIGEGIPILSSIEETLPLKPTALVLAVATVGGFIPDEWRCLIRAAIEKGMDIINGMHVFLNDDPELSRLATAAEVEIWDTRKAPSNIQIAQYKAQELQNLRVLTVGADSSIGKMVTALEITNAAKQAGWDADFVATGQIGMMISGSGIAVDAVVADFISGATESMVLERSHREILIVEGQGTIVHPMYSGVSLGLLHGAAPQALVLCHQPGRALMRNAPVRIPSYADLIHLHEEISRPLFPTQVIAISLNCSGMTMEDARRAVDEVHRESGLPVTDCIKFGCDPIIEALEPFRT